MSNRLNNTTYCVCVCVCMAAQYKKLRGINRVKSLFVAYTALRHEQISNEFVTGDEASLSGQTETGDTMPQRDRIRAYRGRYAAVSCMGSHRQCRWA